MTPPHLHRSSGLLARSALLTLVLAGCATAGAAQHDTDDAHGAQPRVAVLAGSDATRADVAAATRSAGAAVELRPARGTLDAQAQATRLAAEGYDTVVGVGAQARAAVSQADAAEVGAGTHWQSAAH
jgi:hypothetical protein